MRGPGVRVDVERAGAPVLRSGGLSGPYLVSTLFGGAVPWSQLVVYVVGPVLGALLAAAAYDVIARPGDSDDTPVGQEEGTTSSGRAPAATLADQHS